MARPSLPAARRSHRSCPACSLFTCRAATCQRAPCAQHRRQTARVTRRLLDVFAHYIVRVVHGGHPCTHCAQASRPANALRERAFETPSRKCAFRLPRGAGTHQVLVDRAAHARTRGDVSAFRSAPSSAVAAFARRRARLFRALVACRSRGVDLRGTRSHGGARHRGGACQGAARATLEPPPAPARRGRRGRAGPPLQCTRVCARCGCGLWKHAQQAARQHFGRPWFATASLTTPLVAWQAPTDVEGQLAELQRKYRILEARATCRVADIRAKTLL